MIVGGPCSKTTNSDPPPVKGRMSGGGGGPIWILSHRSERAKINRSDPRASYHIMPKGHIIHLT
jgi:hypothetical protein